MPLPVLVRPKDPTNADRVHEEDAAVARPGLNRDAGGVGCAHAATLAFGLRRRWLIFRLTCNFVEERARYAGEVDWR